MKTILIVDDMPIIRIPIAAMLHTAGYRALSAGNASDALALLHRDGADLILLDVTMPGMDGLAFLQHLRSDPAMAEIPVIMLTGEQDRKKILRAGKFGIQGYVLKSSFSLKDLLSRVRDQLESDSSVRPGDSNTTREGSQALAPTTPVAAPEVAAQRVSAGPTVNADVIAGRGSGVRLPGQILTREMCIERVGLSLQGGKLSDVVAQAISMTASPRGDSADLVTLLGRDKMLAAKIVRAANSPVFRAAHPVSTLADAVREIGAPSVRNIAASLGIHDALQASSPGGRNRMLCWQHSLAVATLCERLAAGGSAAGITGHAYLVGLCHDLGEILFRTQFGREYQIVVDAQARTGRSRKDVELALLGMRQGELVSTILKHLGLPEAVRRAIEAFHDGDQTPDPDATRLVNLLRLANRFANAALMGETDDADLEPLSRVEFLAATGTDIVPTLDWTAFRGEIPAMTAVLTQLSADDHAKLMTPRFATQPTRVWLARDPSISSFDPFTAAMESLAQVTVRNALPDAAELGEYDRLVVLARHAAVRGFTAHDIAQLSLDKVENAPRLLWLVGRLEPDAIIGRAGITPSSWRVKLSSLASFLDAGK